MTLFLAALSAASISARCFAACQHASGLNKAPARQHFRWSLTVELACDHGTTVQAPKVAMNEQSERPTAGRLTAEMLTIDNRRLERADVLTSASALVYRHVVHVAGAGVDLARAGYPELGVLDRKSVV